jgi:hypothetical protein
VNGPVGRFSGSGPIRIRKIDLNYSLLFSNTHRKEINPGKYLEVSKKSENLSRVD